MTVTLPSVSSVKSVVSNPAWATLPLFDRMGWKRVRFGDVVENCAETCDPGAAGLERFVAMEHLEPGSLHVRSWGNVADGTTFTRRCRPGQVLFGKRRAYQRKVAVAEFEAVVSGDIYVLAPKDTQRLLPELLPFLCLSERFFQHAVGTSAGSLSPRTNWSSLASFEFDLPPLDQQRRIAEILWAVDEASVMFIEAQSAADQAFEERLREFFDGAVAETHRLTKAGELCEITSSKRIFASDYVAEGVPFYRGKEITEKFKGNQEVSIELFITEEKFAEIERRFGAPEKGDVLLTSVGTLGSPYVVKDGERFYFKDGNLTWFRNFRGLDSHYLFYWLISPAGKAALKRCTIGTSQSAITIVRLKDMEIPVFLPDEQLAFVAEMQRLDGLRNKIGDHIARTHSVQNAFTDLIS